MLLCSTRSLFAVSYEQSAITYVWKNDEDTLRKSPSLTTLNAYLIQNQTIACEIKGSWRGLYEKHRPTSLFKMLFIYTESAQFMTKINLLNCFFYYTRKRVQTLSRRILIYSLDVFLSWSISLLSSFHWCKNLFTLTLWVSILYFRQKLQTIRRP